MKKCFWFIFGILVSLFIVAGCSRHAITPDKVNQVNRKMSLTNDSQDSISTEWAPKTDDLDVAARLDPNFRSLDQGSKNFTNFYAKGIGKQLTTGDGSDLKQQ